MLDNWLQRKSRRGDEEKEQSAENILPSTTSSVDEDQDSTQWTVTQPPSCRAFSPWTVVNLALFTFSLFVLGHV